MCLLGKAFALYSLEVVAFPDRFTVRDWLRAVRGWGVETIKHKFGCSTTQFPTHVDAALAAIPFKPIDGCTLIN
jgi:hypothetical protein